MTQGGSSSNHKPRPFAVGRVFSRINGAGARVRNFITRRFDESSIIYGIGRLCRSFFRLRMRFLGVFLLTFGAYSSVVTVLVHLFRDTPVSGEALYSGVAFMVLSIPLLLSRGNISTALLGSHMGAILCDYLGVRRESLQEYALTGHTNIAFVLGVLAGTLTFWTSPVSVALGIVALVGSCVVFALPENGILFAAVLLLFAGSGAQLWILTVTVASYLLKLVRGKRSLSFYKRDVFAVLVLVTILGGGLFSSTGAAFPQTGVYVLYLCIYFLSTFILYDFRKINRITTALCAGGGILAVVYLAGLVLEISLAGSFVRDAGFLLRFVLDLPVFREGVAPILFMALLPIAVGSCLRSNLYMPRRAAVFCATAMMVALVLCSSGVEVLCACIATALLLLLYRKRTGVFILSVFLAGFVLTVHLTGSVGNQIYAYFAAQVSALVQGAQEFFSGIMSMDSMQLLAGEGLAFVLQEPLALVGSSYFSFVQAVGLIGLLVFTVFIIAFIGASLRLYRKTFERGRTPDILLRFGVVRSPADMRLGGGGPVCAVIALLLCALASPVWQNGLAFELFWLLCGIGAAYEKSASHEIDKADQAAFSDFGSGNASVVLKRKKED
ncbi:MAG: hypothetical protein KHW59_03500 [Clostridiales bacterium]|nr:hypothetical protein [Clostridiales bacterium]